MRIGKNVSIALDVNLDIFFPELIEIGDNTVIGADTMILAHEFLVDSWRTGEVRIGRDVMIGARCLILPGVAIGDGATIAALSLVNQDVPARAFAAGVPAQVKKRAD